MRAPWLLVLVACGGEIDSGHDGIAGSTTTQHAGDCASAIYLLGMPDAPGAPELLRFSPRTFAIDTIGPIDCGGIPREAFSLSVDRAVAYVEWVDYATRATDVFRIRLSDAACLASIRMVRPAFEMTFAGNRLYLSDAYELYTADSQTFASSVVGSLTGRPALAGTPDGALFALYPTGELARIEPSSAQTLETTAIREPGTFALAFAEGDLYLFSETIEQYKGGAIRTIGKLPMRVISAGASTCP